NYLDQLSEVKVPTLLVHGVEDRLIPASWAERAHDLMKNSKIELIRGCGHLPPVEQPDLFNRIIRNFLLTSPLIARRCTRAPSAFSAAQRGRAQSPDQAAPKARDQRSLGVRRISPRSGYQSLAY